MYTFLHRLLSDHHNGEIFTCFGIWHWCYMLLTVGIAALLLWYVKKKGISARRRMEGVLISIAFSLYIADFFLMPLAYGAIEIEKLPFHACTAMCIACFLSRRVKFLYPYVRQFALFGFVSDLVYFLYPAGVMWYGVYPLSYRVLQTLIFHGVMVLYGFFVLFFDDEPRRLSRFPKDILLLVGMTLWAMLGNAIYNGESEGYSYFFNWFFVLRDPLGILPEGIAPYVMPILNITVFIAAELLVLGVISAVRPRRKAK